MISDENEFDKLYNNKNDLGPIREEKWITALYILPLKWP